MLLTLLMATAQAAEPTDLPPFLRGDAWVGYRMNYQTGSMIEPVGGEEVAVGRLTTQDHRIHVGGSFGVAPMTAVTLEFPISVQQSVGWTDAQSMAFDPTLGKGSMRTGSDLSTDPVTGSGLSGVWLGAQVAPFSWEQLPERGNRANWLLDVSFRTPDGTHFYDTSGGERGAGTGSSALRLRSGFSKKLGQSQPWIEATYLRQGDTDVILNDATGAEVSATVINPDSLTVMSGIEVHTFADPVTQAEFAVDFRLGYAYQSWGDLPSGLYLPSVLSTSQGTLSTMGEQSRAIAGIGIYWRIFEYLKLETVADASYVFPTQLEHPYLVQTGSNTVRFDARTDLVILFR